MCMHGHGIGIKKDRCAGTPGAKRANRENVCTQRPNQAHTPGDVPAATWTSLTRSRVDQGAGVCILSYIPI